MTDIQINYISRTLYFARGYFSIMLGILISIFILSILKITSNPIFFFTLNASVTILLFFLSKNLYIGKLSICLNDQNIKLKSYFPLFNRSKEYYFFWETLKEISFLDTPYFKILVLKDQEKKVTFAMNHEESAFELEEVLTKKLNEINKDKLIIKSKTPKYSAKSSKFFAICLAFAMIAWPVLSWISQKDFNFGLAIFFYSGSLFYIYKVSRNLK